MAEITIFERTTNENIAVVVSPHETCEIQKYIGDKSNWDIHHFSISVFDELGVQRILQYLTERGDLGKEIMLLLDDIAFRTQFGSKAAEVLVELYATLRHRKISIVNTLQLHNPNFYDLMSNSE